MKMEVSSSSRRPPAASDAEIRAYLLPRLRDGQPPTLRAMREDLGGGGFSRLLRVRRQVEAEIAGPPAKEPAETAAVTEDLVERIGEMFEQQRQALEEWEQRVAARLDEAVSITRGSPTRPKGAGNAASSQTERLEAFERRLATLLGRFESLALGSAPAVAAASAVLGDVPPSWARQAAAAATASLDGRLESIERTMEASSERGREAFAEAAAVARTTTADALIELRMARSSMTLAMRDEIAGLRSWALSEIASAIAELTGQVREGFSRAVAIADRRAAAIRDVIIGITEIEMAQVDLMACLAESPTGGPRAMKRAARRKGRITGRRRITQ